MVVKRWSFNFLRSAFAVALALLYILVLRSIAVQITPPPQFLNQPYPDTSSRELCGQEGGRWIERREESVASDRPVPAVDSFVPYCQGPLLFERNQQEQQERSQQTSLFVFAVGGGLAVVSSILLKPLRPVAPGLMIGGIVAFFISGIHVWQLRPGLGRLLILVLIFVALVAAGIYAFRGQRVTEEKI